MKRILLAFSLTLCVLAAPAQVKTVTTYLGSPAKRADHLYANEYYQEATELYRRALAKEPDNARLKLQLAESYRRLNDPKRAVRWYREVMYEEIVTAEHQLHYAQALLSTGRVRQAEDWYAQYYRQDTTDRRVIQKLGGIEEMPKFYADSLLYSVSPLAINSTTTDFAPAFYQGGLVFVSGRPTKKAVKQVYQWNETPYLATFFAPLQADGRPGAPVPFSKRLAGSFHEGPVAFYNNDTQIVFTRNLSKGKTTRRLGLFAAQQREGKKGWTLVHPLPFNSPDYSVGYPTVSNDGKTLYFTSDMPGGIGGTDLYVSHFRNGSWQPPTNLGRPINTEGDETSPFLHQDQTLYFASDGHRGLGGLDLYKTNPSGSYIENLGYPINSSEDDFSLLLNQAETTGYYASNRGGQAGNDDLYQLTVHTKLLNILVVDQRTQQPVSQAEITLVGEKALELTLSDTVGRARFRVSPFSGYLLDISCAGYQGDALILDSGAWVTGTEEIVISLHQESGTVELTAHLYDQNTKQPIARELVHLVNTTTGDTISRVTDEQGQLLTKVDPRYAYQLSGEVSGHAWNYPIVEGKALDTNRKNQFSVPINIPSTTTPLRVIARDAATQEPVAWATIRLIEDGTEQAVVRTNRHGKGLAEIDPQKSYLVSIEPPTHYDDVAIVMADELVPGDEHQLEFLLKSTQGTINVEAQLYDSASHSPLTNTVVRIQDEQTGEETTALSDEQGTIRMRVKPGSSYQVMSGPEGKLSFGPVISISSNKIPDTFELAIPVHQPPTYPGLLAETHRSQDLAYAEAAADQSTSWEALRGAKFTVVSRSSSEEPPKSVWVAVDDRIYQLVSEGTKWYLLHRDERTVLEGTDGLARDWWRTDDYELATINNVYFGFDESHVAASSITELDKIASLMEAHPELRIEASTHTDSRGSAAYNRILSQKRAQAITAYLVEAGVAEARIYLRFYGEERLQQPCRASDCPASTHQLNRRGEFTISFSK